MASILDRYGIKEVADVTFYEINADGTAGVDEVRAEFTMTKDGYVLVRQMLLSWELDENVTVEMLNKPKVNETIYYEENYTSNFTNESSFGQNMSNLQQNDSNLQQYEYV